MFAAINAYTFVHKHILSRASDDIEVLGPHGAILYVSRRV